MSFGLTNVPLVDQPVINNCLCLSGPGHHIIPGAEHSGGRKLWCESARVSCFDRRGGYFLKRSRFRGLVLGRNSYIDDIAHYLLYKDVNAFLFRLRYRDIFVSLPNSEFGKLTILYLSPKSSAGEHHAVPTIAKGVQELSYWSTLKGNPSFMGGLNYYKKFIEGLPAIAVRKIVSTPILHHQDTSKPFVLIPHANP
ncbi:hypothetical protein GN244_ATG07841 [Phytophthora infestans]|uniref:Uncharacterized protein n=1 Tax=Phytophthora infestans TaxID=4787 RepID=A0A833TAH7_PHYIN|nr:hypothetical protein GN244_ATG07841 [Phytophthora infestans]